MIIVACFTFVFLRVSYAEQPPNIILVVIDDLGWDDISLHGSNQVPTPKFDKLAAEGNVQV